MLLFELGGGLEQSRLTDIQQLAVALDAAQNADAQRLAHFLDVGAGADAGDAADIQQVDHVVGLQRFRQVADKALQRHALAKRYGDDVVLLQLGHAPGRQLHLVIDRFVMQYLRRQHRSCR